MSNNEPSTANGEESPHNPISNGLWIEGSKLDEWDKSISWTIFSLELGHFFELFLTVPGTWFGLPVPAFLMSSFLTWYHRVTLEASQDMEWVKESLGINNLDHWTVDFLQNWGINFSKPYRKKKCRN